MLSDDRRRASSFGDDARQYDRARPTYPSELIDDVVAGGVLDVVDVGCGTGIVARLLLERACRVVGVDADERMAAVARERGIDVEVARFEEWDDGGRRFDALASGQAWHWVDRTAGPDKAAHVLRPGGRLAVFWNLGTHPADVVEAVRPVYERLAPHLFGGSVALGTLVIDRERDVEPFARSDEFESVELREYRWERHYTKAEWIDELATHSGHRLLEPDVRRRLLDEVAAVVGDETTSTFRTHAVFASRR